MRLYNLFRRLGIIGISGLIFGLAGLNNVHAAAPAGGAAGAESCKGCHESQVNSYAASVHGQKGNLKGPANAGECATCHGDGTAHIQAGGGKGVGGIVSFAKDDTTPVERRNATCLGCHQKSARLFWQGSPHESRDVACTSCHKLMETTSSRAQLARATVIETCGQCHLQKRAQTMRSSHMPLREGKMTCTACHNPHGTVTPALLKENSANETCFTCHAEKRGPFLWEHAPVVESCATCHDPHGSNHENLLKVAKPRLCQQCHVESRHPTSPYSRREKQVLGRSCVSCHANIHGSNHPSGHAFTR